MEHLIKLEAAKKAQLKKIKKVDRNLEMLADCYFSGPTAWQFTTDVAVYGLYEAALLTKNAEFAFAVITEYTH